MIENEHLIFSVTVHGHFPGLDDDRIEMLWRYLVDYPLGIVKEALEVHREECSEPDHKRLAELAGQIKERWDIAAHESVQRARAEHCESVARANGEISRLSDEEVIELWLDCINADPPTLKEREQKWDAERIRSSVRFRAHIQSVFAKRLAQAS